MATRCCHINTITVHPMQNETLIERLFSLSTWLCIQIDSDKSSLEESHGSARDKGGSLAWCLWAGGVTEVVEAQR